MVTLHLDVCIDDYIETVAKELVFSMRSLILYRRPDKKQTIKNVLARAAVDISCVIELISTEWPVRGKPKVPDEIMEELDCTHSTTSERAGRTGSPFYTARASRLTTTRCAHARSPYDYHVLLRYQVSGMILGCCIPSTAVVVLCS